MQYVLLSPKRRFLLTADTLLPHCRMREGLPSDPGLPHPDDLLHICEANNPLSVSFWYTEELLKISNKLSKLISISQENSTDVSKLKHKNVWGKKMSGIHAALCTDDNTELWGLKALLTR